MRRATTTLTLLALGLWALTIPAAAKPASRTETSGFTSNGPSPGFDRFWVDDDGVQHARGWIIPADVFGEEAGAPVGLSGSQIISLDWNIDLLTGDGDFHGSFERDWTVKGTSGTFTGRFQATIEAFIFEGTSTSRGSGG